MLCYVMLCYVMLCYVMLYYVMLCYFMLCYINSFENRKTAAVACTLLQDIFTTPNFHVFVAL